MDRDEHPDARRRRIGDCVDCVHARVMQSAKGSEFWRCARADREPAFTKYPPLPVRGCTGREPR